MNALVLVVDDYDDARELMALVLEGAGFSVLEASNGLQAVALAKAHRPDLVLMDLFMPGMDGLEATRLIKEDPALRHVPVVAHTAKPSPLEHHPGLFAAVCVKPCPPDRVLATIRQAISIV